MKVGELIIGHLRSIGERNPDRILVDIQQGPGGDPAAEAQAEDAEMAQTNQAVEPLPEQDHEGHLAVHTQEYEAYGKLPAIKEHIEMHEMLMMQAEAGQAGGPAQPPPGGAPGAGVGGPPAEAAAISRQARA
jgi:hypothetical protein